MAGCKLLYGWVQVTLWVGASYPMGWCKLVTPWFRLVTTVTMPCSWLWIVCSTPAWCVHEHTWRVPGCELCEVLLLDVFMNISAVFLIVSCVKYSCFMCLWTYLTCSWLWVVWSTPASCVYEHTWHVPDCELCEVLLLHVFMNIPDVFLIVSCVKYSCFMCLWT